MTVLYNMARMTTVTTGTGTITLGSAVASFLTFAQAGVQNLDVVSYVIEDGNGTSREVGTGTYTSAGTTLTRTPINSTNSNAAINLSGTAQVAITALKSDIVIGPASATDGAIARYSGTTGQLIQNSTALQARTAAYAAPLNAMAYNNLAINGGMLISQMNGTASTAIGSGTDQYVIDQWMLGFTSAVAVVAGQQVTSPTPPAGFTYALQMKATTADASLAAGEYFLIRQPIEGYRCGMLAFGGASAQAVTVGFWAYATISGTMTVALRNSATNRSYVSNVTISSGTTWEYKTVTIPGDTSGTWLTDTGIGIDLVFCFGTGSTFQGTNNTWNAANNFGTSTTTNFFATNNNVAAITGVSVWPGSDIPVAASSALLQRALPEDLQLCQRYLPSWNSQGRIVGGMYVQTTTVGWATINLPVQTRVVPTALVVGTIANVGMSVDGIIAPVALSALSLSGTASQTSARLQATASVASFTAGQVAALDITGGTTFYLTGCQL